MSGRTGLQKTQTFLTTMTLVIVSPEQCLYLALTFLSKTNIYFTMTMVTTEINQGEIKITSQEPLAGKFTFKELGLKHKDLFFEGGKLRMDIELGYIQDSHFFRVPTIELAYFQKESETFWVVEFNGQQLLEKSDKSGHATILLLDRKALEKHVNRHVNSMIIHAEFPEPVHLDYEKSYIHILEKRGE